MNESILQQFNCCVSCYFIAFFTVVLTLLMSSPSSHKKLESPLDRSLQKAENGSSKDRHDVTWQTLNKNIL